MLVYVEIRNIIIYSLHFCHTYTVSHPPRHPPSCSRQLMHQQRYILMILKDRQRIRSLDHRLTDINGGYALNWPFIPMRPKDRGLAQHGGPPGWQEMSDPAGCDFVHADCPNGPHHLSCSGAGLLLNVHKKPSWASKAWMARYSSRPTPSLWLRLQFN
jgi:hypothetical protein